ncbi:hypothetical protein RN69_25225 [Bradyrhizobium japonicum]|nr:hypothetical protein RN69_25225 [Bradyrhizobium japonicum]KMJ98792.1 hypothetical protein CF64_11425 [Bradyrhizobium japonicum]
MIPPNDDVPDNGEADKSNQYATPAVSPVMMVVRLKGVRLVLDATDMGVVAVVPVGDAPLAGAVPVPYRIVKFVNVPAPPLEAWPLIVTRMRVLYIGVM